MSEARIEKYNSITADELAELRKELRREGASLEVTRDAAGLFNVVANFPAKGEAHGTDN